MLSLPPSSSRRLAGAAARRTTSLRPALALATPLIAALLAAACAADRDHTVTAPDGSTARQLASAPLPALMEEPVPLVVPTYEGSGESVHPDVVDFPAGWHGARYWLTMTPYPRSDSKVENPSILVSHDGRTLAAPDGLANPVIGHRGRPSDYNSDPELVYEAGTDRLLLFYRFVDRRTNTILVSSSTDGRTWVPAGKAFWARGHAAVSPTIAVRNPASPARMWYVDAGRDGCKAVSTRVMTRASLEPTGRLTGTRWSEPDVTNLAQPGYVIWHIKVRYVPTKGEYWALYAAYPEGPAGCDVDDLFFARSSDGVHWETFAEPLLRHEEREWTAAAIYRSSFLYDASSDQLRVWLSARGADQKWRMAYARFRYSELLGEIGGNSTRAPRDMALARRAIGHSEHEP